MVAAHNTVFLVEDSVVVAQNTVIEVLDDGISLVGHLSPRERWSEDDDHRDMSHVEMHIYASQVLKT